MHIFFWLPGKKNPAAYLGLDFDSAVSSVSDPDISGMSDTREKKKEKSKTKIPESHLPQKKNAEGNFERDKKVFVETKPLIVPR